MYDAYINCVKEINSQDLLNSSFKKDNSYRCILEHVNHNEGIQYLNNSNIEYSEIFNNNKDYLYNLCIKNDSIGNPEKQFFENFGFCSPTNLRYIYHSLLILSHMSKNNINNVDIVEIGGGYGGLCFFIYNNSKFFNISINSYKIFDLYDISILQKNYLKFLNINIDTYQLDTFDGNNIFNNSFLISNYAFSEITMDLQKEYINKVINPYISYGFLCWNAIELYDFIDKERIYYEKERPVTGDYNLFVYVSKKI